MAQREPGLQETLNAFFDYAMSNVYTSIPGIIVSIENMDTLTVNVQPTINVRSPDGLLVAERPPILNVQLKMPLSTDGGLSFPVKAGDPVSLIFSMRGLDTWKSSNGYPSTPSDIRKFDVRDCYADPCLYPPSQSRNDPAKRRLAHNSRDVVLVHNIGTSNEVEIRLKVGGGVEINAPGQSVVVNSESAQVNTDSVQVNTETAEVNATDYTVNSENYRVNTVNYSVIATGENVSEGSFNFNGSVILNGVAIEDHDHGGVVAGGDRTSPFGT